MAFLLLLPLLLLFALPQRVLAVEAVLDGTLYHLSFDNTVKENIFSFVWRDPAATTSVLASPDSGNTGTVDVGVYFDAACMRKWVETRGFNSFDVPYDVGSMYGQTMYVKLVGSIGAKVQFTLLSSVILNHTKSFTLSGTDGYDYLANDNIRYFRAFICDADPAFIRLKLTGGITTEVYINEWNSTKANNQKHPVGKPVETCADHTVTGSFISLDNITASISPTWIFIGIQLLGDMDQTRKVAVTTNLEIPTNLNAINPFIANVCVYEDCLTEVVLDTTSQADYTNGKTLQILLMPTENYDHGESAVYVMTSSTNNPPRQENGNFYMSSAGNVMEIDKQYYELITAQSGFLYTSVRTTQSYRYPQYEDGSVSRYGNFTMTYLYGKAIIRANGAPQRLTLLPKTDEEGKILVASERAVFNSAGINHPYVLISDGLTLKVASGHVPNSYYIKVEPVDGVGDLQAGLYIGGGMVIIPNINGFLYTSREITQSENPSAPQGTIGIWVESNSNHYFEDGAYLLDIYNNEVDTATGNYNGPDSLQVNVSAIASWVLEPNAQYGIDHTGSATPIYFSLKATDITRGVSIYAELSYSTTQLETVSIYASLTTPFPDETSKYVKSSFGSASVLIGASDFADVESVGGVYTIYMAVVSTHRGQIITAFSEGKGIDYNIGDGQQVEVVVTDTETSAVVNFHSDETNGAPKLLINIEGETTPWPSNVMVKGCISTEILKKYENCETNKFNVNEWSTTANINIPLSSSTAQPNYFICLFATFSATEPNGAKSVTLSVFAEDFDDLSPSEPVVNVIDYVTEPTLLHFITSKGFDYSLVTSIENPASAGHLSYKARVCHDKPAISVNDPLDVEPITNSRRCSTYTVRDTETAIHDLLGDIAENDKTTSDDSAFILSSVKYLSYFPSQTMPQAKIRTELYEDKHVTANKENTVLYGEYRGNNFFRLKIASEESGSVNDSLVFKFSSEYPFSYCLSKKIHATTGSIDCLRGVVDFVPTEGNKTVIGSIPLNEYDPSYDAKVDVYIYFSYFFPVAPPVVTTSMSVTFSNTVSHFLNIINSDGQNIDKEAYFYSMNYYQYRTFYTTGVDPTKPIRFLMTPHVDPTTIDTIPDIYFTNQIAVASVDHITGEIQRPTVNNSLFHSAGIVLFDFLPSIIDGEASVTPLIASLTDPTFVMASYRTALIGSPSDTFTNPIGQIKVMELDKFYDYKYDPRSSVAEDKATQSALYYYPAATEKNTLKVFPCAGAPGIYASYISSVPHWDDGVSVCRPTGQHGYKYGNIFSLSFYGYTNEESLPPITKPTGVMFNFTGDYTAMIVDPDPANNVRWNAQVRIMSETATVTGGPIINDRKLKVSKTKGLQINIDFMEGLSGVSGNPDINNTRIEYALYAIPSVSSANVAQYFDASPYTYCGLNSYGFPVTADRKTGEVIWVKGNVASGADDPTTSEDGKVTANMTLKTSYDPNKYVYPASVNPTLNTPETGMFIVNVIAREVNNDNDTVIGYSVYDPLTLEFSGSFPISVDGLYGWELALIIIAVLVVVGLIIALIVFAIKKKRMSMGYGNLDGHGNLGDKHGLNVELPDDDLSISATDVIKSEGDKRELASTSDDKDV